VSWTDDFPEREEVPSTLDIRRPKGTCESGGRVQKGFMSLTERFKGYVGEVQGQVGSHDGSG